MSIPLKLKLDNRLNSFFDRDIAARLDPATNRFLRWTGRDVRKEARRNLKPAKQKKVGELTEEERKTYNLQRRLFAAGIWRVKPTRPKVTAKPGEPPRLHFKPNPLRDGLKGVLFAIDKDMESVVVGPSNFGDNAADRIERRHPFMLPAIEKVRPKIPQILRRAVAASN